MFTVQAQLGKIFQPSLNICLTEWRSFGYPPSLVSQILGYPKKSSITLTLNGTVNLNVIQNKPVEGSSEKESSSKAS
jgi:hypothetical protein